MLRVDAKGAGDSLCLSPAILWIHIMVPKWFWPMNRYHAYLATLIMTDQRISRFSRRRPSDTTFSTIVEKQGGYPPRGGYTGAFSLYIAGNRSETNSQKQQQESQTKAQSEK